MILFLLQHNKLECANRDKCIKTRAISPVLTDKCLPSLETLPSSCGLFLLLFLKKMNLLGSRVLAYRQFPEFLPKDLATAGIIICHYFLRDENKVQQLQSIKQCLLSTSDSFSLFPSTLPIPTFCPHMFLDGFSFCSSFCLPLCPPL